MAEEYMWQSEKLTWKICTHEGFIQKNEKFDWKSEQMQMEK